MDDDAVRDDWGARMAVLEKLFGSASGQVAHATVPFEMGPGVGGAADVVYFEQWHPGELAVTAELLGRDEQKLSALGNYELAVCSRKAEPWASNFISQLSHYTVAAALNPGETMDIKPVVPKGSSVSAVLFDEIGSFQFRGKAAGVLLCIGITAHELAACREGRVQEVLNALREKGIYPYTDLQRESVVRRKKLWGVF